MKTTHSICAHPRVEFYYDSRSKNAKPGESDLEHVRSMINQGYVEGELCSLVFVGNRQYEFSGWWKIVR